MSPVVTVHELDPITGSTIKVKATILRWYEKFQKLIEGNSEAAKKYREELFGPNHDVETPAIYNDISLYKELQITENEFLKLPIHVRAKMIAHNILHNLVELRSQHIRLQKEKLERMLASKKGKNGT